jgi:hypothetical protein
MRPKTPERLALERAAGTLARGPLGGGHYLELAYMTGLPPHRAQAHVKNMVRARQLVAVGQARLAHANRLLVRYAPADLAAPTLGERAGGGFQLQALLSTWPRR